MPTKETEESEREKAEPAPLFDIVREVIRFYIEHGYLTEDGLTRDAGNIEVEKRHCSWVLEF